MTDNLPSGAYNALLIARADPTALERARLFADSLHYHGLTVLIVTDAPVGWHGWFPAPCKVFSTVLSSSSRRLRDQVEAIADRVSARLVHFIGARPDRAKPLLQGRRTVFWDISAETTRENIGSDKAAELMQNFTCLTTADEASAETLRALGVACASVRSARLPSNPRQRSAVLAAVFGDAADKPRVLVDLASFPSETRPLLAEAASTARAIAVRLIMGAGGSRKHAVAPQYEFGAAAFARLMSLNNLEDICVIRGPGRSARFDGLDACAALAVRGARVEKASFRSAKPSLSAIRRVYSKTAIREAEFSEQDPSGWVEAEPTLFAAYAPALGLGQVVTRKALRDFEPSKTRPDGRLRVFQGPMGSAGQPQALARLLAEQSERYAGESVLSFLPKFGYGADVFLSMRNLTPEDRIRALNWLADRYDVFHFHGGAFFWSPPSWASPSMLDLAYFKAKGCTVIMNFRGTELRSPTKFAELNPYAYSEEDPYGFARKFTDDSQAEMKARLSAIVDRMCVVDAELRSYAPDATVIPRVLMGDWRPQFEEAGGPGRPVRIVHAPSRPGIKGTTAVKAAVETLRSEGFEIDFVLVQNMSHAEAVRTYQSADIIVDQLRIGWYGVLAVEAMALGKATVAYIREDLVPAFEDGLPVVTANPDTITAELRRLIEDENYRRSMGRAARAYFEKTHAPEVVLRTLEALYDECVAEPKPMQVDRLLEFVILDAQQGQRAFRRKLAKERSAKSSTVTKLNRVIASNMALDRDVHRLRKVKNLISSYSQSGGSASVLNIFNAARLLDQITVVADPDSPRARRLLQKRRYRPLRERQAGELSAIELICRGLRADRSWAVADWDAISTGGQHTLSALQHVFEEVLVRASDAQAIAELASRFDGLDRLARLSPAERGCLDLLVRTPPIASFEALISSDYASTAAAWLNETGVLITYFVRDDAVTGALPPQAAAVRRACTYNESGVLIGLPEPLAAKFEIIENRPRNAHSISFVSFLVLRRRSG
jgi:hypothetical protein